MLSGMDFEVEPDAMPEPRQHVVKVTGRGRGGWDYVILRPELWEAMTAEERQREVGRGIRRRWSEQREQRKRENGPRDRYTLEQMAERDGWTCQLCETPVSRQFRAPHPCTPSIDHVVSLAAGGTDTLDNLRLTHQFCNADRWSARDCGPEERRLRLARRLLTGPRIRYWVPTREQVLLAAEILGTVDQLGPDLSGWGHPLPPMKPRGTGYKPTPTLPARRRTPPT
jgi:hypothetical protein